MQVCVFKVEIASVLYLLCEYACICWLGIKLALHGYECTRDLVPFELAVCFDIPFDISVPIFASG